MGEENRLGRSPPQQETTGQPHERPARMEVSKAMNGLLASATVIGIFVITCAFALYAAYEMGILVIYVDRNHE
jgi:hypothetical protein